ncbi:MAG: hypothetical protein ACON4O_07620 [Lentimonas sp.]
MQTEQKLAKDLLKLRQDGFPSPLISLIGKKRIHILRYIIFASFAYLLWATWSDIELRSFLLLGAGIVIGALIKEMTFYKKIGNNWFFTEKITDWKIVSEIADKPEE